MKKSAALLVVLTALTLFVAACGSDTKKACSDGDILARVDGIEGCYPTCDDGACSTGLRCQQGVCVGATVNPNNSNNVNNPNNTNNVNNPNNPNNTNNVNNPNNPNNTNNVNPNNPNNTNNVNNPNNTNNTNNVNNPIDPVAETACQQACDLLYGSCFTNNCTLAPEDTTALQDLEQECLNDLLGDGRSCAQAASDDSQLLAGVQNVATQTCDELSDIRCGEFGLTEACGCATPSSLGAPCTSEAQCAGGDITAGCIPEVDMDGNDTGWVGGYCYALPCPTVPMRTPPYSYRSSTCGSDGVCRAVDQNGETLTFCVADGDNCSRTGYSSQVVSIETNAQMQPVFLEVCLPACSTNADCGMNGYCGNGACLVECDTAPIGGTQGNPSFADICANSGGTCISANSSTYCSL